MTKMLLAAVATSLLICQEAASQSSVVATIRPLQFIVEAIALEGTAVTSVIKQQDTPHHFTMSPSDRLALENASLLLWIGPEFELYLADFFHAETTQQVITATDLAGVTIHELAESVADPHLWLDTANARLIAAAVAERLSSTYPQNQSRYAENLNRFDARLTALDSRLGTSFSSRELPSYGTYHNAYQYFEKRYGLAPELVLLEDPEVEPGIRRLLELRQDLAGRDLHCLFVEADSNRALIDSLFNRRAIDLIEVDLLGYQVNPGPDAYFRLIESVGDSFIQCLGEAAGGDP